MFTVLIILTVLVAILLIGVVLIQKSKGGGLSSSFGSANQIMQTGHWRAQHHQFRRKSHLDSRLHHRRSRYPLQLSDARRSKPSEGSAAQAGSYRRSELRFYHQRTRRPGVILPYPRKGKFLSPAADTIDKDIISLAGRLRGLASVCVYTDA